MRSKAHTPTPDTYLDRTLRVLKRRLENIAKLNKLQKKELTDAEIRRRLKITPKQLKLMREESSAYSYDAGLEWRMRYASVPNTLHRGDRTAFRQMMRTVRMCFKMEKVLAGEAPEKFPKPEKATLLQPLSRYRAIRCMVDERAKWDAL